MSTLSLHEFHQTQHATFGGVNGVEVVFHYGDVPAEHAALRGAAGVSDLSFRSRLCLLGGDRIKFLHGQVTNNVNSLQVGDGCYAALVNSKGKIQSDLNIYRLADELLLDFEPGLTAAVIARLEKYVIADDVQLVDVASLYGLLSVQGPKAPEVVTALGLGVNLPAKPLQFSTITDTMIGTVYLTRNERIGLPGFDLFVPTAALGAVADKLIAAAKAIGGRAIGWEAFEIARIEAGRPRFGADMDESNLAPETGIESRAISYSKGCYIGQEVIARVRTYGQVAKALRGLRFAGELAVMPKTGDRLFAGDKEVGYLTSVTKSPALDAVIALGYVRREASEIGAEVAIQGDGAKAVARIVALPFAGQSDD
ncbi:MAG TPA: glycine cleavage T C-terminal barrel domain-containing protein [Verrucomicrobiae bacterium]|nr:glycine cleavage T C-terminal barrel domain-containing protein [Verrucomicrobiae bacterium]